MADEAAAEHPWLCRPEWASGEVHSHTQGAAVLALGVAVFWNAISWTCVIAGRNVLFDRGILGAIWILLFPAVGIGLAIWAARALIRWRVYGESRFLMSSVPGQIGGSLIGMIRADRALRPARPAQVTLACVRRSTSGSGSNRSTTETTLWSDKGHVATDGSGAVPIAFYIPPDCRESDDSNRLDSVVWRLQVSAPGAVVAYRASFEVPVFKVAESPAEVAEASRIRAEHDRRISEYRQSAGSPIRVRLAPDGATEAYFPPLRAPFAALSLLAVFAIWTAIAVVVIIADAPLIFRIVWPITDGLMLGGLLALIGGSTMASARGDALTIRRHLFAIPLSFSRIPSSAIAAVRCAPGMSAGAAVYSRIRVDLKDRRARYFGDGIADVNEAAWVALKLSQALAIPADPDSSNISERATDS